MSTKSKPVIAIDGPGGVGKTTLSKLLAKELDLKYVDTGAMYRAVAVALDARGVDVEDPSRLRSFLESMTLEFDPSTGSVKVDGEDLTGSIRTERAGELASLTSCEPLVRERLTEYQRTLAEGGGVVMEGRDIGTVVLPDADVKFFLDAPGEVRASRRHGELAGPEKDEVRKGLTERDARDSARKAAPLRKAADAVYVDTGELSIEEVLAVLLAETKKRVKIEDIRN